MIETSRDIRDYIESHPEIAEALRLFELTQAEYERSLYILNTPHQMPTYVTRDSTEVEVHGTLSATDHIEINASAVTATAP